MRIPTAFALCFAAITACAPTCAAQPRVRPRVPREHFQPKPPPGTPKPNILAQQVGEGSPMTTLVTLDPFPLSTGLFARSRASFAGSFSYTARPAGTLNFFSLDFYQRSAACAFGRADSLALLIDGQPVTLSRLEGPMWGEGIAWVAADTEGQVCSESAGIVLSQRTVARLAAAQNLSARIGDSSLVFTPEALGALRQLVARVPVARKPFN